jgi:DNA-binding winged helix-turn-helix (wHTH) protein
MDIANQCLWHGSQIIKLRPKAFALLNQLVGHPGRLVTKEELLAAVWPETFVSDAVLKVTIGQLRDALDDDPNSPRFIETAHRRGYRFIAQIAQGAQLLGPGSMVGDRAGSDGSLEDRYRPLEIVGREDALSIMRSCLNKMQQGQRQVLFVTGEAWDRQDHFGG